MHLMERERRFCYTLTQRNDVICNQRTIREAERSKNPPCYRQKMIISKLQILHIRWTIQEPSKLEFLQFIINFVLSKLRVSQYTIYSKLRNILILKFLLK